jgi:hypothetical protein
VKTYFLSETDRRFYYARANASFMSEPARPGHLALFNKNDWTTWHVPARQCEHLHGWELEADDVPAYWRRVLVEIAR